MLNYGYGSYDEVNILSSLFAMLKAFLFGVFIIGILLMISMYKIYRKAGRNGWEAFLPVYNIIVLLQIVELPLWYIVLFFIPIVNIYAVFKVFIELAHKFGKTTIFGIASVFFSVICMPILAFGSSQYEDTPEISTFYENTFSKDDSISSSDVKFCPSCGNKMNSMADTCFMCGKKF